MRYVLDASAVLAALKEEAGADRVGAALDAGIVSAANLAEVAWGLVRYGNSESEARSVIAALACTVVPADEGMAVEAGFMRMVTDRAGLSLADRFCLVLARRLRAPAMTADRSWLLVAEEVGVEVELIR